MMCRILLSLLSAALICGDARAAFSVPGFELVYTFPVETSLVEPDLREAKDVWQEMIASAEKTIDIEQFYVTTKEGEPLEPVLEELEKAGRRGVKICFLAEDKFAKVSAPAFERLGKIPNLELRVLAFSDVKADGIIHAKFFIVDGKSAYVGSQNFDWRSLKHIHELGLKITQQGILRKLRQVFEHDWEAQAKVAAGKTVKPLRKEKPEQCSTCQESHLVASPWAFNPDGVGDSESELVRLIDSAEKSLVIQVMDYAPLTRGKRFYAPIDNALRDAAARGVKIKLLVSHWNTEETEVAHLKSLSLIPGIEVGIATLPQAKEGYIPFSRVIHSKYMVVDDKMTWLGTSNWSGGHLDNSRNLELMIRDEDLAARLAKIHDRLWTSEYTEPLDLNKEYPKPQK